VAISPDGRWLAAGTDDKTYGSRVYLWDLSRVVTDYERPLQLLGHKGQIDSLIFSDDSRLLASGSEDNTVRVWEVCSGRCLYSIGLRNATLQVFNASTRDGWQRFVEGRTTQLRLGKVPSQSVWLPWTPDITPNPSDPTLWAGPDYPSSNIVFFRIENT
jgi:WD40 repeat protein